METTSTSTTSGVVTATSGVVDKVVAPVTKPETVTSGTDKVEVANTGTDLVAKIKKEKDNYKARVLELEAQAKEATDKGLLQKQEYKTLYEQTKEALEKSVLDVESRDKRDELALKKSSVRTHLLKLGLNPAHESTAFRLMDISKVVVDKETQAVLGSEDAAKLFHEQFKELGIFGTVGVGVSHQAPTNSDGINSVRGAKTQKEFDAFIKNKYGT